MTKKLKPLRGQYNFPYPSSDSVAELKSAHKYRLNDQRMFVPLNMFRAIITRSQPPLKDAPLGHSDITPSYIHGYCWYNFPASIDFPPDEYWDSFQPEIRNMEVRF